jgi:hypothetical protein
MDSLCFGNYPGATVSEPAQGWSICRISSGIHMYDCLSRTPTPGKDNKVELGKLTGRFYNKDKKIVTGISDTTWKALWFENKINFNSDSTYTTAIYPASYSSHYVTLVLGTDEAFSWINIEPIDLSITNPDTAIVRDIHATEWYGGFTGIKKENTPSGNKITLINYPNPFNMTTNFMISIPDGMQGKTGSLDIFNVNGQLIRSLPLQEKTSSLTWNGCNSEGSPVASGVYYYRLVIDKQQLKSGSTMLLK